MKTMMRIGTTTCTAARSESNKPALASHRGLLIEIGVSGNYIRIQISEYNENSISSSVFHAQHPRHPANMHDS